MVKVKLFSSYFLANCGKILSYFFGKILGRTFFLAGQTPSVFKKANLVSMRKTTTEKNRNISTKIVAATFDNEIGSEEFPGEKVWRNYRYFDARKSDYLMEKVNYPENTFSKSILNFDNSYFDFLKNELQFFGREIRKKN